MIFTETKLEGAYVIELEKIKDERGFFARSWDKKIFEEKKLNPDIVQCNVSFNKKKGTLRGLHYQISPCKEAKLVRCTKGSIFEVMVDLRSESKTFRQWQSLELRSSSYKMLYVPEGFALGFQTLENNAEVFYQMSQYYNAEYAKGIRWDDPYLNIKWPMKPTAISKKDLSYPLIKG